MYDARCFNCLNSYSWQITQDNLILKIIGGMGGVRRGGGCVLKVYDNRVSPSGLCCSAGLHRCQHSQPQQSGVGGATLNTGVGFLTIWNQGV